MAPFTNVKTHVVSFVYKKINLLALILKCSPQINIQFQYSRFLIHKWGKWTQVDLISFVVSVAGYITACYFTSWSAQTSLTKVRLPVKEIDPNLCTHIMYAFAKLDVPSKSVVAIDPGNEYSHNGVWGNYKKFNHLKSKNPNLKTLLSVGGETPGIAEEFSMLSASTPSLQQFANNTIRFLREHGFDGLDVDWEYPYTSTKSRFTNFLKVSSSLNFQKDVPQGQDVKMCFKSGHKCKQLKKNFRMSRTCENMHVHVLFGL